MSAEITWVGLDELKAALFRLPAELTQKAAGIVKASAEAAAAEIKAAYPEGETGNLRKGVRVGDRGAREPYTVRYSVRSSAPHVHLYETGSQTRQTALGYHRGHMFSRFGFGPRQGANVFVPIVVRRRRAMFEDLIPLIEQAGLDVRR